MSSTLANTEQIAASAEWIGAAASPAPLLDANPDVRTTKENIAGLDWTFRSAAETLCRTAPVRAWQDPQAQGWKQIKLNPLRSVWQAEIDGRRYFLKYYAHTDWRDRLKKVLRGPVCEIEFRNALYALKAGIPTVPPLAFCPQLLLQGRAHSLLITQAIQPAYPLNEYWDLLRSDENGERCRRDRQELIELLAQMIARAHQAGFEHRDMHAANILVHPLGRRRYETAFVDLQSVNVGHPLSDQAVVKNLGLLNQWFRRNAGICDRLRFLRRYLRWRDEYEQTYDQARPLGLTFDDLVYALADNAARHAERLWAKRDRRALRSSKYFSRIRAGGGWKGCVFLQSKRTSPESAATGMVLTREWWRKQLKQPLALFESAGGKSCKDSHSARVAHVVLTTEYGPLPVIVKQPLARNWLRRLRMLLGASRSRRGWKTGYALLNRDITAARPLAVLERRFGPLVFDSLLITDAIPNSLDLDAHLRKMHAELDTRAWRRHKRNLSALLARQMRLLADRKFVHHDCKAQNLLVADQPQLKLFWIDMDGLRRVRRVTMEDELLALMRLHVSLLDLPGITRTDRIRFLKDYLARFGASAVAWRDALRTIDQATSRKLRVKWKRRRWKVRRYGRE